MPSRDPSGRYTAKKSASTKKSVKQYGPVTKKCSDRGRNLRARKPGLHKCRKKK